MEVFDILHERYDSWYDRHKDLYLKELSIIPKPQSPSLELGVGTGRFAAPLNIDVGLDSSLEMLSKAKIRGVESVAGDALRPPFREESFRTIYLIFTLCFISDPLGALRAARDILRKGGKLIACIIPADSGLGKEYMSKGSPFYRVAKFFRVKEFEKVVHDSGYGIEGFVGIKLKYEANDFICYMLKPAKNSEQTLGK